MTSLSLMTPSRPMQTASVDTRRPLRTVALALAAPLLLTGAVLGAPGAASAATSSPGGSPFGSLDEISAGGGVLTVAGWTIDPDTTDPIEAHLYVDGRGVPAIANYQRDDVAAAYPGYGPDHGFEISTAVEPGEHTVCVYGINVPAGENALLQCVDVVVASPSPFGYLDEISAEDGVLTVTGWTADPDTADPIETHLYVDGIGVATAVASYQRDDVAAAYPEFGPNHGYEISTAVEPGEHEVCVYGIDVGAGENALLQCADVVVADYQSPFGYLDEIVVEDGVLTVTGWTADPDTADSIGAHLYVDDRGVPAVANYQRDDVAAAYPEFGPNHGYEISIDVEPGEQTVCVYGINVGAGENIALACVDVIIS
jgi:hypothetical protein